MALLARPGATCPASSTSPLLQAQRSAKCLPFHPLKHHQQHHGHGKHRERLIAKASIEAVASTPSVSLTDASTDAASAAAAPTGTNAPLQGNVSIELQTSVAAPTASNSQAAGPLVAPLPSIHMDMLPEKHYGNLRGGRYPFHYDPVYGLPIVREVVRYSEVLRDIRQGHIAKVYFFEGMAGRCLLRYRDGRVKQSVVPTDEPRMREAMAAHGVPSVTLPPEPRHVPAIRQRDPPLTHPLARLIQQYVTAWEYSDGSGLQGRRGPQVGPYPEDLAAIEPFREDYVQQAAADLAAYEALLSDLDRLPSEEWEAYKSPANRAGAGKEEYAIPEPKTQAKSWMERIHVSQDVQALIVKYVPIVGPIIGSAFIIGLYMASRLVKGDLTDRMKMMTQEDDRRKRTVLKEARIAFLEEEVPALVARNIPMDEIRRKCAELNKKLGEKLEVSEGELQGTVDACRALVEEGAVDLRGSAASTSAAERMLAEQEAAERAKLAGGGADAVAAQEGGDDQKTDMDILMDMSKLSTARIRKATDPKIMEVKRRVRQARRKLKRDSKVQMSDEIIFFDDVAGNEQAKVELMEVVDFFRQPSKFKACGAKAPKGVLLVGPPGNGKTLMARAVAGESGVAFISSSASEFIEMYMGLGAARVRDLFNTARKMAPCIIFIDELDAVGRARRGGGQGNDERDNTVNQLLTEMDGFEAETQNIVIIGATNRKDVLDPALTRAGRFDRSIEVRRPDLAGRLECVQVHLRDKPVADNIDFEELARLTGGMSGAQIAGVCNTASYMASREGRQEVTMDDLRAAVDQAKYGKSYDVHRFVSPARKRRFAVIEAGISLVASLLPAMEPVQYTTIVPSSRSPLGRTVLESNIGRYTTGVWTRRYLGEQLLVALAGRAAEEVVFGVEELSSLSQQRIMLARQVVVKMMDAGFSSHPDFEHIRSLGSKGFDPSFEPGRWTSFTTITDDNMSRSEAVDVDIEMERMLNGAYAQVKAMIQRNRAALDLVADLLLDKERVDGSEIRKLVEQAADKADLAVRAEGLRYELL